MYLLLSISIFISTITFSINYFAGKLNFPSQKKGIIAELIKHLVFNITLVISIDYFIEPSLACLLILIVILNANLQILLGKYKLKIKFLQILLNSVLVIAIYLFILYNYKVAFILILIISSIYLFSSHVYNKKRIKYEIETNTSVLIDSLISTNIKAMAVNMNCEIKYYTSDSINAHISHVDRKNIIIISSKALEVLNSNELDAIILHEFGHLKYKHGIVNTSIRVLNKFLFFILSFFLILYCNNDQLNVLAGVLFCINLWYFYPILNNLIKISICRKQEFIADSFSAKYNPFFLLSALNKISVYDHDYNGRFKRKAQNKIKYLLFWEHPSISDRIEKIKKHIRHEI